jgi:hypothetical protein
MDNRLIKITAGTAAAVVIVLGGVAIGRTGSGSSASATPGGAPDGGGPGIMQGGGGPGAGAAITGTTATKVKDAALAKYPGGTVERVMQLPDGSYVVHVITGKGEVHVLVSKAFKVTGTAQGGPPRGGGMPGDGAPPSSATPPSGTTSDSDSQSS